MSSATAVAAVADSCPECSGRVVSDDGERVCSACGLVVDDERIDHGPEWRAFNATDRANRSRVGAPRTERRHDKGVGSEIGYDRDGNSRRMARLRMRDNRAKFSSRGGRNRSGGLADVQRMCDQLSMSDTLVDRACRLFSEAHEAGVAIGLDLEQVAAATVLATVREQGLPMTGDDILEFADVPDERRLYKTYHEVVQSTSAEPEIAEPRDYLERVASEADVGSTVRDHAREVLTEAQSEGLHVGKAPAGMAAAALYYVTHARCRSLTQEEAADVGHVCVVTIRNHITAFRDAGIEPEVDQ